MPSGSRKTWWRFFFRKAHHLVFDGRTITGSDPFDDAGKERRLIDRAPDDLVGLLVGIGDMTGKLRLSIIAPAGKGEKRRRLVAVLRFEPGVVDRVGVETRDRAGFHPADAKALLPEPSGQTERRIIAHAAGRKMLETDVDPAVEKRAGGYHHRPDQHPLFKRRDQPGDAAVLDEQPVDHGLPDGQVLLLFQDPL